MVLEKNNDYLGMVSKLTISLFITIAIFITALIVLLHTSLGFPFLQKSVEKLTDYKIDAAEFKYDFRKPVTFYFEQLVLEHPSNPPRQIEEVNLTFAPVDSLLSLNLVLKDLWIKGTTFTQSQDSLLPKSILIKELSLEKVNYSHEQFKLENADVQLANWQNDGELGQWDGAFMFSAQSAEFNNDRFDELLINGTKKENDWEFWSVTLSSEYGEISASASLSENKISFGQLSFTDSNIQSTQSENSKAFYTGLQSFIKDYEVSIARLDLLNVSAAMQNANVERLNLTAQNIFLDHGKLHWLEEKESVFTFNAESLVFRQMAGSDLLGDIKFSKDGLTINSFSSKLTKNGYITIKGELFPDSIDLQELSINGMDLALNADEVKAFENYWQSLTSFNIDNFAVKHSNLVVAEPTFPVYVRDMNLNGTDVAMQKVDGNYIWRGDLNLRAATANVNQIELFNPVVNAKVNESQWHITSALPFASGQLKLTGKVNSISSSNPWQLEAKGLAIPSNIYQQWFNAALPLQGEHDLDVDLHGLAVTKEALRYSLSGTLNATLHNTELLPTEKQPLAKELADLLLPKPEVFTVVEPANAAAEPVSTTNAEAVDATAEEFVTAQRGFDDMIELKAGKIKLALDRGIITLDPMPVTTEYSQIILRGKWDVVTKQGGFSTQ